MNTIKRNILKVYSNNGISIIFIFSIVYSVIFNLIDFIRNPVKAGFGATLALFLLSILLVFLFFLAASLNKILFNIITFLSILFSSVALYYVIIYKIRVYLLDTFILIIQTNMGEALGVLSYDLVLFVLLMLFLTIIFLNYYNKKVIDKGYIRRIIILLLLSPSLYALEKSRVIMPYAFPYSVKMYNNYMDGIKKPRKDISQYPSTFDSKKNGDLIVIFLLGESARADHFAINGYKRQTSPNIIKAHAISLPNVDSIEGVTNRTVPLMITRATFKKFGLVNKETSFISIFKKHGFTTAWISYQDVIDNSYSNIAPLANEAQIKVQMDFNPGIKSGMSIGRGKILDGSMLPELDKVMKHDNKPKFIVLHCIGSHWNTNLHYPDELQKFNPICTTNNVSRCSREELINSYDNSILYTDLFISQVYEKVASKNAIVVYSSDHGEFLGENGNYGHIPGKRDKEITNPAVFIWMSDTYKKNNPEKYRNLLKNKDRNYTSEIFFHSILDSASISGEVIDKGKSLFEKI